VALSDNLLHYWSLEEASGDAIDAHGAADLGENVSAIGTAAGKVGNARDIGSAAYFNNAGVGSDSTKSYAVQAWINADTLTSFRTVICFRWDAAGGWWCGFDAGRITFYAGGGGSYPNVTDDVTLSTGTWYHCVWNFAADGSVELFVDGLSVATGTAGRSATASTGIAVGRDSEDTNNPFDGRIDELGLWERVLTSAEVTELHNGGDGRDYDYIVGGGQTADVPVGLIDYTGLAPTTAKSATPPIALIDLLGIAPGTSKSAAVAAAPIDYTAPSIDGALQADVPTAPLAIAAAAPTTSKSAPLAAAPAGITANSPGTTKAASLPAAPLDYLAPAPTTAKSAPLSPALLELLALTPGTTKSAALSPAVIEYLALTPETTGGVISLPKFPGAVTVERLGFTCTIERLGLACTRERSGLAVTVERRS